MAVLLTLVRKELLDNLLSHRFSLCFIAALLAVVICANVQISDSARRSFDYSELSQIERRAANPSRAVILRQPAKLSTLFTGVLNTRADAALLQDYTGVTFLRSTNPDPISIIFPVPDLIFIFGIIFSLLALVVSYDAINGEHVGRTLHLLMSNPVSRSVIFTGKVIGQWLTMIAVFLPAWIAVMALLSVRRPVNLAWDDWLALTAIGGATALYLALFTTIGVVCSALTRRPTASLFSCVVIWAASVMVLPSISPTIAGWIEATLPPQVFEARLKMAENDLYKRLAAEHYTAGRRISARSLSADQASAESQKVTAAIELKRAVEAKKLYAQIQDQYERELIRQLRIQRLLSWLSPYAIFADSVSILAATDAAQQSRFRQNALSYDRQYFDFARRAARKGLTARGFRDMMPPFVCTEPPLAERISEASLDVGVLIGFLGLGMIAGFWLFDRFA